MGILLLEDGRCFEGPSYGAQCTKLGKCVQHFNDRIQEVLTDPSYFNKSFMTYPHIGNTGVNTEDQRRSSVGEWPMHESSGLNCQT